MVDKILLAIFMPGFLVVFFTRVTLNHFMGLLLAVALIAASAYKGYTHTWPLIIIDAASLTFGFWLAGRMMRKEAYKEK
ncbi:DUF2198 family protein [Bacillus thermotolerans]|uniref:DUF2198 family protein n=1 Tax=Bacillus thermotolerans TaxID=1221996 RepID=A0A0F5HZP3_BACTR|nr:DUF2198 family protein [Bacillus thermotolerans]KKB38688.1 hypothetical protein QY97_01792 [Bacillus thermotolerans]KKB41427.1 hypothetical protein QY95_00746 [Bacillus thermotolerans]KKB43978.1 hypothetical protein QY96_00170 [Bacillus thermotolerans]